MEVIHSSVRETKLDIIVVNGLPIDWELTRARNSTPSPKGKLSKRLGLLKVADISNANKELRSSPIDALSEVFPEARIVEWACKVGDPDDPKTEQLQVQGNSLLEAFRKFRGQAQSKVIFIAHSVGGLVVKQALLQMSIKSPRDCDNVRGVVFLGTPHSFKSLLDWSTFFYNIGIRQSPPRSRQSYESLIKVSSNFELLLSNSDVQICCVQETKSLAKGATIVPLSAAIISGSNVTAIAAQANHFDLARLNIDFDSHHELMTAMRRMAEDPQLMIHIDAPISPTDTDRFERSTSSFLEDIDNNQLDGRKNILQVLRTTHEQAYSTLDTALELHDHAHYDLAEKGYQTVIALLNTHTTHTTPTSSKTSIKCVLFCRDKRANVLYALGRYDEVETECIDIKKIKLEQKPIDHISILRTARNHAMFLRRRGEYQNAFSMLASTLDATDLSPRQYEHIMSIELLSKLLKDLKQFVLAEYLLREVIEISAAVFGPVLYSFTLSQLSEISSLFWIRGQHRRAEVVSCYAYVELREQLGPDHPAVFRAAKRYANYLRYQGRLAKSNKVLRDILPRMQKKFGNEHPLSLWTICGIAAIHLLRGYVAEGRVLLENILQIMVEKESRRAAKNPKMKPSHEHRDIRWIRQVLGLSNDLREGENHASFVYFRKPEDLPPELVSFLMRPSQPTPRPDSRGRTFNDDPLSMVAAQTLSITNNKLPTLAFLDRDAEVQTLLTKENVNAISGLFGSALHAAAYNGNTELVKLLLAKGADPMKECGIFISPIKAATIQGHTDVVKVLLNTKPFGKLLDPDTPYMTDLELAILVEREKLVDVFLKANQDPNYESILFGNALAQAIPTGNSTIVSSLLEKANIDIDTPSPFSLLPIVEVGLAAGDAMALDAKFESEYLHQLNSTVEQKQVGTLEVFNIMIPRVEASSKTNKDKNLDHMIDRAIDLMAQPEAPPPYTLSIDELEELLKKTEDQSPGRDHLPYVRRTSYTPEGPVSKVKSHRSHRRNSSLQMEKNRFPNYLTVESAKRS